MPGKKKSTLPKEPGDDYTQEADLVKQFFKEYLNSPNYKKRLKTQQYEDPKQVITQRLNRLSNSKFSTGTTGSQYVDETNTVTFDPTEASKYGFSPAGTIAHEYSHLVGSNFRDLSQYNTLNTNEYSQFVRRNKAYNTWPEHDARPWESKADLDELRYLLHRDKLYDTGTQQFTPELLKQAKSKYKDRATGRLFNNFSDDDLIYLMNNIAYEQDNEPSMAKNGKKLKINPKYFDYSALQDAEFGMMMDPGTRFPGMRIPGYTDPQPSLPQGPVPIGSIDTSKIQPGKMLDPNSLRHHVPRAEMPKKPGVNYGDAALLALSAFDAILPNPYTRQTVVQPQMAYNPNPYGTGSQALMKHGGIIPDNMSPFSPHIYKAGGTLSPEKAKEMLKDGKANGKKLTKKQKQYFGMVAAGKAAVGGVLTGPETGDPLRPGEVPKGATMNLNSRKLKTGQIDVDALVADRMAEAVALGYDPFIGKGKNIYRDISSSSSPQMANEFGARLKSLQVDPAFKSMTPEQKLTRFYDTGATGTTQLDDFLRKTKTLGGSPAAYWQRNATRWQTMNNGGVMYDDGDQIDTMWGGEANLESYNPYDGGMVEFSGNSHDQGGIGMQYNGNSVEVEGGEYASRDPQGNLNIYGNMYIPGSKTKFKKAAKAIADKEKKYDKLTTIGSALVNNTNPANKWEQLKFNAGKVMMQGGSMGMADLSGKKEQLSSIQRAMLDMAEYNGLDPFEMSKGKLKKAKKGATISQEEEFFTDGDGNDPTRADRNRNPGNIKYGKFAQKYGARKDKDGFAIFPSLNSGLQAMKDLLGSKSYKDLSVKDAIHKWTAGQPYRYDLGNISNKRVADLSPQEFETVIGTMRKGEGTIYGVTPRKAPPKAPVAAPRIPDPGPFTPYDLPNITARNPPVDNTPPGTVTPPYDTLTIPRRDPIPSNVEPLHLNQVLPEIFAAATNKVEPVPAQRYEPQLYVPYQVSFQDRINANQSAFNAQMRAVGAGNPSAMGTLAAQKYAADQNVYGDEFRTNQAIASDITNKNIALVNDANLKNLGLADTQMIRQSQARSNTRAQNQLILNSLSSKYANNELENKKLAAYENLYDYRFVPQEDGGLSATYFGPSAMFNYEGPNSNNRSNVSRTISRYDAQGNLKGYAEYEDSDLREMQRMLDVEMKKRKLPLMPLPALDK